jgi:F-type H+-transporting ATPase subunit b
MWFALFNFAEVSLVPDLSLLIVLILFVLLVFLLNAIIFKPITKVIDQREHLTTGAVAEARQATRDYDHRLQDYQEKIRAARADSYRMLEAQRAAALGERGRILAQVKSEVTEKIEFEKREINKAAVQARTKLETDAKQIAESISRNILKRPLGGASS